MEFVTNQELTNLKKYISDTSWAARNAYPKGHKFMSTRAIISTLQKPKDWNAIALKCSQNPNKPEYYGKTVDEILQSWKAKGDKGAYRGNILDEYIQSKLSGKVYEMPIEADQVLINKIEAWQKYYDEKLIKLQLVGFELWLNSKLGLSTRLDSLWLYMLNNTPYLLVLDWKNTQEIASSSRWDKLIGPMQGFDDVDAVKYTLQCYIYKYILEEEYKLVTPNSTFVQITEQVAIPHKPAFPYDKCKIEEIISYAISTSQASNKEMIVPSLA